MLSSMPPETVHKARVGPENAESAVTRWFHLPYLWGKGTRVGHGVWLDWFVWKFSVPPFVVVVCHNMRGQDKSVSGILDDGR